MLPVASPPMTTTRPSPSVVAVCPLRAALVAGVRENRFRMIPGVSGFLIQRTSIISSNGFLK